ncbi:hypothetical protein GBAR_LOCUS27041 [Geodia barretti]|uniref:DUF7700 domain-containing protein n=1 Tax=Geodia barretti TaxID=519541 RepID=A0AA35TK93_GEOBA|nr:hypothetical protein GBAR_LOCUS27041 [Geodia barretti]
MLRFDCFRISPHYHYRNAPIGQNHRLELDFTAEGDSLAWTLDKIQNRLPIMLLRCQANSTARQVDQRDVEAAVPHIVAWAETKTHRAKLTQSRKTRVIQRQVETGQADRPFL